MSIRRFDLSSCSVTAIRIIRLSFSSMKTYAVNTASRGIGLEFTKQLLSQTSG